MVLYNVNAPYVEVDIWFTSLPAARKAYRAALAEHKAKETAECLEGATAAVELVRYSCGHLTGRELARRLLNGEGWAETIDRLMSYTSKILPPPREAIIDRS